MAEKINKGINSKINLNINRKINIFLITNLFIKSINFAIENFN